ncbi:hypothetical protein ACHAWX_000188 [Stephanocyclus meneghinianus]
MINNRDDVGGDMVTMTDNDDGTRKIEQRIKYRMKAITIFRGNSFRQWSEDNTHCPRALLCS